jgi:hypothetical protein
MQGIQTLDWPFQTRKLAPKWNRWLWGGGNVPWERKVSEDGNFFKY